MTRRSPPRDAGLSALSAVPDHTTLFAEIKSFVREEVARQVSLLAFTPPQHAQQPSSTLVPPFRRAIQQEIAQVVPEYHQPPPVSAPLSYAQVVARPPPPISVDCPSVRVVCFGGRLAARLIEQGKAFGFVGKELYNFVEKERNRLKEERDAERIRYRQHLEFLMEQERENSRLRIQKEKERLGLCAAQSGLSLAARTPSSVTDHVPNKQSYQDHVQLLRQKMEGRRRMFETWDARHKRGKEPVGARPLRAGQNKSTDESSIGFTSESKELAAESPVAATKATEGLSDGDEVLCLESLVNTEMPSVMDLAQPPCLCVAIAAKCEVRSTSRPVDEDPCTESGAQSGADAHCELGNVGASSSSRCKRRSPEEDASIAQPSVKLPASQGVHKLTENPDCIGIIAEETSEISSALQMLQANFSKVSTEQRAKGKRRRKSKKKREAKGVNPPMKSRIAKRQSTQRKLRLRFVAFASRYSAEERVRKVSFYTARRAGVVITVLSAAKPKCILPQKAEADDDAILPSPLSRLSRAQSNRYGGHDSVITILLRTRQSAIQGEGDPILSASLLLRGFPNNRAWSGQQASPNEFSQEDREWVALKKWLPSLVDTGRRTDACRLRLGSGVREEGQGNGDKKPEAPSQVSLAVQ
ncbi:hypothetical protein HPB51_019316 [Rhipicephalus microplus]|uniref:Uncharacterized protein n=1 Tax=Rhipicephalus microplus TaxID=6941 RepID=A0A9J6EBC6_RHIMP|nr:hypothetical protein HPB51_019316 [Rhipicephalus microplus]